MIGSEAISTTLNKSPFFQLSHSNLFLLVPKRAVTPFLERREFCKTIGPKNDVFKGLII